MQLRILFIVVVVFLLWSAPSTRADGPFAGSPIDIQVQVVNMDDYPGYEFYLKYGLGEGNPYATLHLTKLQPDSPTKLEGNGPRMTEIYLLVVPQGQPVSGPPSGSVDATRWLTEIPTGGLQSVPLSGEISETRLSESANHRVVRYRVRVEDGRVSVTWVASERGEEDALRPGQWGLPIGIGLSVVGVLIAVLVRRIRNRSRSNTQSYNAAVAP